MRFTLALLALGFAMLLSSPAQAAPPTVAPTHGPTCTKTLAAGGDLSTFLGTLGSGDVGCLREGEYTDGCSVSWGLTASPRATLRNYPGEQAVVHSMLVLSGSNLTAYGITVRDIDLACGGDMSGFDIAGTNDEILYSEVYNVTRHGVLTHTGATNATVHGNWIEHVGSECNLDHGVYFQKSGRVTRNVFKDLTCGYGIHLYSGPADVLVSGNVVDDSKVRSGILVNCASNCTVVNNIFTNNENSGIAYRACSSGCVVDNNITWHNYNTATPPADVDVSDTLKAQATNTRIVDPVFADALYHLSSGSPAVDTGTTALAAWPDRDLTAGPSGTADLGAYELAVVAPAPTPTPTPTATPTPSPDPTPEPTPEPTPSPTPTPTPTPPPCSEPSYPAPTGLAVGSRSRTSINLDWASYPETWGYRLGYRVYVYSSTGALLKSQDASSSSATVSSLTRNTTYRFAVTALLPDDCDADSLAEETPQSSQVQGATQK